VLKVRLSVIAIWEEAYPGIFSAVSLLESISMPYCPSCESADTSLVNVGVTPRTVLLSLSTTRFHLRSNDRPDDYRCNQCRRYFGRPYVNALQ
jgi:hypothetical protein